jgi:hypothetical protein
MAIGAAEFLQGDQFAAWAASVATHLASAAQATRDGFTAIAAHWEAFQAAVQAVAERVQLNLEAMTAPVRALAGIWEAMWQAVAIATNQGSGEVVSAGDRIAGFFRDVLLPVLDGLGKAWTAVWQELQIQAVHAINAVLPIVEQLRDWMADYLLPALAGLQEAWDGFWSHAGPLITAMWGHISPVLAQLRDWLGNHLGTAIEAAGQSFTILREKIGGFFEWLGGVLKPIADKLGPEAAKLVDALTQGLRDSDPKLKAAANDTAQAFLAGLDKADMDAASEVVGKEAMAGMVAGIATGSPAVQAAAVAAVRAAIDAAKAEAGISSPSQVMADEVGVPLMTGLRHGMEAGLGPVLAFSQTAATQVVQTWQQAAQEAGRLAQQAGAAGAAEARLQLARDQAAERRRTENFGAPILQRNLREDDILHSSGRELTDQEAYDLTLSDPTRHPSTTTRRAALINQYYGQNNLNEYIQTLTEAQQRTLAAQKAGQSLTQAMQQATPVMGALTQGMALSTANYWENAKAATGVTQATGGLVREVGATSEGFKAAYTAGSGLATMTQYMTAHTQELATAMAQEATQAWAISKAWAEALRAGEMYVAGMKIAATSIQGGNGQPPLWASAVQPTGHTGTGMPTGGAGQSGSYYGVPVVSPLTPNYTSGGGGGNPWLAWMEEQGALLPQYGPAGAAGGPTVVVNYQASAVSVAPQHEMRQAVEQLGPTLVNYLREQG